MNNDDLNKPVAVNPLAPADGVPTVTNTTPAPVVDINNATSTQMPNVTTEPTVTPVPVTGAVTTTDLPVVETTDVKKDEPVPAAA